MEDGPGRQKGSKQPAGGKTNPYLTELKKECKQALEEGKAAELGGEVCVDA